MDELAKANQRGLDLQYQLTDSENERMVLWDILAERKAKDLHAADLNGGKCAIHPDDCPVNSDNFVELTRQMKAEVERLRSPEISGDLKKKTLMLMEEIAKRKFPMMKCECTCEDFRFRGVPCKHMMTVEIAKHNGDLNAD